MTSERPRERGETGRGSPPSSSPSAAESVLPPPASPDRPDRTDIAGELGAVIQLLLRVGTLLACSGAAAFRVREAMQRTAAALGVKRSEFIVTLDSLSASVFEAGEFRTQVVRLPPIGVDMNQLCRIELLTRALLSSPGQRSPADVHAELDRLQTAPRLYPKWVTVPSLGAACGAFCAAGHGTPLQIACAFVGAAAGHALRLWLLSRRTPLVTIVVTSAFVSATAAELVTVPFTCFTGSGEPVAAGIGILASVLYLIPGVPLVTSLIDLVHLDVSAGMSRAAYATVLVGCIAVGVFTFFATVRLLFPW